MISPARQGRQSTLILVLVLAATTAASPVEAPWTPVSPIPGPGGPSPAAPPAPAQAAPAPATSKPAPGAPPQNLEPIQPDEATSILGKAVQGAAGEGMGRVVDILVDADGQ